MITFLTISLVVLIVLNIWLASYTAKKERERRKQLRERMDEYDDFVGQHLNSEGALKQQLNETIAQLSHTKTMLMELNAEYTKLREAMEAADPHAGHQEPVNGGEVNNQSNPSEPANKPLRRVNLAALDLQELKLSYEELAKSYDYISRQHENPSKRYIISNLVKLYKVENMTNLAKALGVSTSSLVQKVKK